MNPEMNICVAGVGGVGGVLAAMLGTKYGDSLSLIARGAHADALQKNGLVLHSRVYGEISVKPRQICERGADLDIHDCIFVCVKNYSLDDIAKSLRPAVDEHTVIIPVMNGVEAGDRLRELFPDAVVCDGVIYIISSIDADHSIAQPSTYAHVFIGSNVKDERHTAGARSAYEALCSVGFDARWAEDIQRECWGKFLQNCAYNTITARHLCTSGAIHQSGSLQGDAYALISESYQVAMAEGISLSKNVVEEKFDFIMNKHAPDATSSMKRDMEAHRAIELDAFSGAVIRKAEKHGIKVPVTRRYHAELLAMLGE